MDSSSQTRSVFALASPDCQQVEDYVVETTHEFPDQEEEEPSLILTSPAYLKRLECDQTQKYEECSICCDDFQKVDDDPNAKPWILMSGCAHRFHVQCARRWMEREASRGEMTCPLCRSDQTRLGGRFGIVCKK